MDAQKRNAQRSQRRRFRVRRYIHGTAAKPRLSVYRTNLHVYAQLIDDDAQVTLASASSNEKGGDAGYGGNIKAAAAIGAAIAAKAKEKGIAVAVLDRGHYSYHGRVKALARAATEAGLVCTGLVDQPRRKKVAPVVEAKKPKAKGVPGGDPKKKPQPAKA